MLRTFLELLAVYWTSKILPLFLAEQQYDAI
jgi:hypothetical protein